MQITLELPDSLCEKLKSLPDPSGFMAQLFKLWDTDNKTDMKPVSPFAPSELESPYAPSVYKGKPLSLEDMENAIRTEACRRNDCC